MKLSKHVTSFCKLFVEMRGFVRKYINKDEVKVSKVQYASVNRNLFL